MGCTAAVSDHAADICSPTGNWSEPTIKKYLIAQAKSDRQVRREITASASCVSRTFMTVAS